MPNEPSNRSADGPPMPPDPPGPPWAPGGRDAHAGQDVRPARERAERAPRWTERAAERARAAEQRASRRSPGGAQGIVEAAGDAAAAALTAVSAVAAEASKRRATKARLDALEQGLVTARAGGRVDLVPPTREEALAIANRVAPSSSAASVIRGLGLILAGIVALSMMVAGTFGLWGLFVPLVFVVLGGTIGDRVQSAERSRRSARIQADLTRASLAVPVLAVAPVIGTTLLARAPGQAAPPPRLMEATEARTGPEVAAVLGRLIVRVEGLMPDEDLARLHRIRDVAVLALPPADAPLDLSDHEIWLLRQICVDYLPGALERYLALPSGLAGEPVLDGRSARQVLDEQLDLIEGRLRELARRAYRREAGGLLDHARFVADSLRPDPFQERLAELAAVEAPMAVDPVRSVEPVAARVEGTGLAERERDLA